MTKRSRFLYHVLHSRKMTFLARKVIANEFLRAAKDPENYAELIKLMEKEKLIENREVSKKA